MPEGEASPLSWVPHVGRVHAGDLHAAIESADGVVPFEFDSSSDEYFALTVEGDSMVGAAILDGDIVIVKRQSSAHSGDIVVVLIEEQGAEPQAAVKRLRRRGRRIELHPENPDYEVIVPEKDSAFRILGHVVEVRRRL